MSDEALVDRLRSGVATYDDMADAAARMEAQEAEITRLRAALATARREGMEEAAQRCELPCIGDHMNAYGKYFAAAIRAAAKEGE